MDKEKCILTKASNSIVSLNVGALEANFEIVFTVSCCETMFDNHKRGDSYQVAFAKAVYEMYVGSTDNPILTKEDFTSISKDSLKSILFEVISQDEALKGNYETVQADNPFERFYQTIEMEFNNLSEMTMAKLNKVNNPLKKLNRDITRMAFPYPQDIKMPKGLETLMSSTDIMDYNNALQNGFIGDTLRTLNNIKLPQFDLPRYNFPQIEFPKIDFPKYDFPQVSLMANKIMQSSFDIHRSFGNVFVTAGLSEQMVSKLNSYANQINNTVNTILNTLNTPFLEKFNAWDERQEILADFGWFSSREFPQELIDYICEKKDELSEDEVNHLIIDHFRKNKCKLLKSMVYKWNKLSYFEKRKIVFHEALVNHSRKYYNTSVTMLSLHIEGVISDFVRITLQDPKYKTSVALETLRKEILENTEMDFMDYDIISDVTEEINSTFLEHFDATDPDLTSNHSRHKIAHGHVYEEESEANSLKKFLYLNELYYFFMIIANGES